MSYFPADIYNDDGTRERVYVKKLGADEPKSHYAVTRDERVLRVRSHGLGYRLATVEEAARDLGKP